METAQRTWQQVADGQGKARRRTLTISQQDVGDCFTPRVSDAAISKYERGERVLPYGFTAEDYEAAFAAALRKQQENAA